MRFVKTYENPVTCDSVSYTTEPVPVVFQSEIDQIKQIAAGEYHNVILTV
jgi:hypothetical protein